MIQITEQPMKSFRVEKDNTFFDIFITDTTDLSSIVNITDENGERIPYNQWDEFTELLRNHLI
jgi:hypothetical protein